MESNNAQRPVESELRASARDYAEREGVRRLKFHVVAWVLEMVVITPLNALIELQDNGFQRLSRNGQRGSWDPWVLYTGGIGALVIAGFLHHAHVLIREKSWPRLGRRDGRSRGEK